MKRKVPFAEVKQLLKVLQPVIAKRTAESLLSTRQGLTGEQPIRPSLYTHDKQARQRLLQEAPKSLPMRQVRAKSNLLLFRTRNQLLHISDFTKLVSSTPLRDLAIQMFQARDPHTMLPKGGYFLLFGSHEDASAYMVEALGKTLNGVNFYLEMCDPEERLQFLQNNFDESFTVHSDRGIIKLEHQAKAQRSQYVLVRGFPSFVESSTIERMLWDYDLDTHDPIRCIKSDKTGKVSTWLLKFTNNLDPQRFVRFYNGKHFDNDTRLPKVYASQMN
jgi:hypothetical protein